VRQRGDTSQRGVLRAIGERMVKCGGGRGGARASPMPACFSIAIAQTRIHENAKLCVSDGTSTKYNSETYQAQDKAPAAIQADEHAKQDPLREVLHPGVGFGVDEIGGSISALARCNGATHSSEAC